MLEQSLKDDFVKLDLTEEAVAVRFCFARPAGIEPVGHPVSLCACPKIAATEHRVFYMSADDEICMGRMVLGMMDKPPKSAAGMEGYCLGIFGTPAANARHYYQCETLIKDSCNYVVFAPISLCDFDPDLIIAVADTEQADILMRSTSFLSGDLWESRSTYVMSCAWMYPYPYINGKVNIITTGMHLGLKKMKAYPAGLHIIIIPFQKIPEVTKALEVMEWYPKALDEDPESVAWTESRLKLRDDMADDPTMEVPLFLPQR